MGFRWEVRGSHSQELAKKRQNQMSLCSHVHTALRPTKPVGRGTDGHQSALLGLCPSMCSETHHP